MNNTKKFTKIVVHGGKAHLDDVFASAIAMAEHGEDSFLPGNVGLLPIYRREPTKAELEDKSVIVLDVGREYDPEKSNWDHHQLERGTRACAMSLLAKDIVVPGGIAGVYKDSFEFYMRTLYPWWDSRVDLDSCGPYKAAEFNGADWGTVCRFFGPLEGTFLRMFEEEHCGDEDVDALMRGQLVYRMITSVIDDKISAILEVTWSTSNIQTDDGGPSVSVIDFTKSDPKKTELVSDSLISALDGVAIFHSKPRNPGETYESTGLTLLRLRDDPKIDFSKVSDDPEVAFAHKGGFIATTKTKDVEKAFELIRKSIV